jgi:ribosomal protein S18 acetylase RimI-like enzyme
MSKKQFEQKLIDDGVRLELSVGAFDTNEMIAFTINGYDLWQGKSTAYDSGTGVIPKHRGKGIGKELFKFMFPKLVENGINQYLLEVISSNERAVNLYLKLGLQTSRELAVFRLNTALEQPQNKIANVIQIRAVKNRDWHLFQTFWDGYPSWQNSIESIERSIAEKIFFSAYFENKCIGYGIVSPKTGSVLQLAVARDHRRKGIGSLILTALQSKVTEGKPLKMNNIDHSLKGMLAFCRAKGFQWVLNQHEMIKNL